MEFEVFKIENDIWKPTGQIIKARDIGLAKQIASVMFMGTKIGLEYFKVSVIE